MDHMNTFTYPIELSKQPEGGYLVLFPDFPEAITQGESKSEAIEEAADCLEEAIANRIEMKLEIPHGIKVGKNQLSVSITATLAAKAALYLTIKKEKLTNTSLAKKLNCDEKEIRRLLDPHFKSKIPRIEQVLHQLGQKLEIGFSSL